MWLWESDMIKPSSIPIIFSLLEAPFVLSVCVWINRIIEFSEVLTILLFKLFCWHGTSHLESWRLESNYSTRACQVKWATGWITNMLSIQLTLHLVPIKLSTSGLHPTKEKTELLLNVMFIPAVIPQPWNRSVVNWCFDYKALDYLSLQGQCWHPNYFDTEH